MKRYWSLVVIGLLGLSLATVSFGASKEEMLKGAKALDKKYVEAFNRQDADALTALYWNSPDAVLYPPDALQLRGYDAIGEGNAKMVASMKDGKLELTDSHQMVAGDVVIGWGLWRYTGTGGDGKPVEMVGRYTDVKGMRDGRWVYLIDHASAPLPPPPEN